MKILCTGLINTDGTKRLLGIGTKFLIELRPGDYIEVNNTSLIVIAIVDNFNLIVNNIVPTGIMYKIYLTKAYPAHLTKIPELSTSSIQYTGIGSSNNNNHTYPSLVGGQALNYSYERYLAAINNNQFNYTLPSGFEYFTPYTNLTFVNVTAGSTKITASTPDTKVSTTANSNIIAWVSGSTKYLLEGARIKLDGNSYQITKMIHESMSEGPSDLNGLRRIYLDKVVPKTYANVLLEYDNDFGTYYPAGTIILLNGKMHVVASSTIGSLRISYPVSTTAEVTIRRPLIGNQYSINTIEFGNIDLPKELLKEGNLIIVQEIRGEDSLYNVGICYNEVKYLARIFDDSRVLTTTEHKRQFAGIVCIGVPTNGFKKVKRETKGLGNGFSCIYGLPSGLSVNDYIKANGILGKITSIGNSYQAYTDISIPANEFNNIEFPNTSVSYNYSYTPLILSLSMKLAEKIIKYGIKRVTSVSDLLKEFLYSQLYANLKFAKKPTLYSVYEPLYLAIDRTAAPPTKFSQLNAISINTSNIKYSDSNIIFRRCGLYLTSLKG